MTNNTTTIKQSLSVVAEPAQDDDGPRAHSCFSLKRRGRHQRRRNEGHKGSGCEAEDGDHAPRHAGGGRSADREGWAASAGSGRVAVGEGAREDVGVSGRIPGGGCGGLGPDGWGRSEVGGGCGAAGLLGWRAGHIVRGADVAEADAQNWCAAAGRSGLAGSVQDGGDWKDCWRQVGRGAAGIA